MPAYIALIACTVNVYAVPTSRPVIVIGNAVTDTTVSVNPPGEDVAVYDVIADPPFAAGAVNDTTANEVPATADTPVGASGATIVGVTEFDALDALLVPIVVVAVTVNVYADPFVRPVNTYGDAEHVTALPELGVIV